MNCWKLQTLLWNPSYPQLKQLVDVTESVSSSRQLRQRHRLLPLLPLRILKRVLSDFIFLFYAYMLDFVIDFYLHVYIFPPLTDFILIFALYHLHFHLCLWFIFKYKVKICQFQTYFCTSVFFFRMIINSTIILYIFKFHIVLILSDPIFQRFTIIGSSQYLHRTCVHKLMFIFLHIFLNYFWIKKIKVYSQDELQDYGWNVILAICWYCFPSTRGLYKSKVAFIFANILFRMHSSDLICSLTKYLRHSLTITLKFDPF